MLGAATPDEFRLFFPRTFLDDSVKNDFKKYTEQIDLPYADLTDYINASIISTTLIGLKDPGNIEQEYDKGRTKSYKGSLPVDEGSPKDFEVTFMLKEALMNWMILRKQLEVYLEWSRPLNKNFLPPVYCHVLDEEDRVIYEIEYNEIRFKSISDITLNVQDNGIISKQFSAGFTYNRRFFKYHQNEFYNNGS